jgi:hypothetical protein
MSLPDWVTLEDEHGIPEWLGQAYAVVMVTLCALIPPLGGLVMWALLRG